MSYTWSLHSTYYVYKTKAFQFQWQLFMYLDSQSSYFGILGYTIIYFKMTASNPVYPETSEKEGSFVSGEYYSLL